MDSGLIALATALTMSISTIGPVLVRVLLQPKRWSLWHVSLRWLVRFVPQ